MEETRPEEDGEAGASLTSPPYHLHDPWSFPPLSLLLVLANSSCQRKEEVPEAHFADADPEVEAAEERRKCTLCVVGRRLLRECLVIECDTQDIPEPAGEAEPWREEPVNEALARQRWTRSFGCRVFSHLHESSGARSNCKWFGQNSFTTTTFLSSLRISLCRRDFRKAVLCQPRMLGVCLFGSCAL